MTLLNNPSRNGITPDPYSPEHMESGRIEVQQDHELRTMHPFADGNVPTDGPPKCTWDAKKRLAELSYRVRSLYPGAIGELLSREMAVLTQDSFVFGDDSLLNRVANQIEEELERKGREDKRKQATYKYLAQPEFTD